MMKFLVSMGSVAIISTCPETVWKTVLLTPQPVKTLSASVTQGTWQMGAVARISMNVPLAPVRMEVPALIQEVASCALVILTSLASLAHVTQGTWQMEAVVRISMNVSLTPVRTEAPALTREVASCVIVILTSLASIARQQ